MPFPGVDNSLSRGQLTIKHTKYYQWVAFTLFFQVSLTQFPQNSTCYFSLSIMLWILKINFLNSQQRVIYCLYKNYFPLLRLRARENWEIMFTLRHALTSEEEKQFFLILRGKERSWCYDGIANLMNLQFLLNGTRSEHGLLHNSLFTTSTVKSEKNRKIFMAS